MKRKALQLFKVLLSVVLLYVVYRLISIEQTIELFENARYWMLLFSLLALLIGACFGTLSWYYVLRARLPKVDLRNVFSSYWTGLFFNSFFPSIIGGDVIKGYKIVRKYRQTGFVVTSIVVDRFVNMLVLVCIGIAASLAALHRFWLLGTFLMLVVTMLVLVCVFSSTLEYRLRTANVPHFGQKLTDLLQPLLQLVARPRNLWPVLLAALGSQFFKITQNIFVIFALRLDIAVQYVYFLIPIFGLVSAVPISIGGLGIRELVAQVLAQPLGVNVTYMTALSLGGHVMVVITNCFGLIPFLLDRDGCRSDERITDATGE